MPVGKDKRAPTEVPSPINNFDQYLPRVTRDLDAITTPAAGLPLKSDLAFHRTLDRELAMNLDEASERVLKLTRELLDVFINQDGMAKGSKSSAPRRRLEDEEDVTEGYRRGVVDVVDGLLEDADSCLDEINGQKRKAAIEVKPSLAAAAGQKLPGPFSNVSTDLPLSNSPHSYNLRKSQLDFPDPVDNSIGRAAFKPNLPVKHHAMVPLGYQNVLDYTLDPDPDQAKYQLRFQKQALAHPYFYEMRHIPYPTSMFTVSQPVLPPPIESMPAELVDTPEALAEMTEELKQAKEIAVDLEHHDMHSYYGFTCLMQISTREKDWLVDTLKLRGALREDRLGGVLADPSIVKVFHGARHDIVWLQKDFDLYVVNLFDTYHATKVLGMTSHGLANLLKVYCNFEPDKRYQLADWRVRPLTPGMRHYAQADTHFLLYIYDQLRNELLVKSRPPSPALDSEGIAVPGPETNPQRAMRQVLSLSSDTALATYETEPYDVEHGRSQGGWLSYIKKWFKASTCDSEVTTVVKHLHFWRDRVAREEDESPYAVIGNTNLNGLAKWRSPSVEDLRKRLSAWPFAARRAGEIVAVLDAARKEWAERLQVINQANAVETPSTIFVPRHVKFDAATSENVATDAKATLGSGGSATTAPGSAASGPSRSVVHERLNVSANGSIAVPDDLMWGLEEQQTDALPSQPVKSASSQLFGSSIARKRAEPESATTTTQLRAKTSQLFGSTAKGTKLVQSQVTTSKKKGHFAEVVSSILADIAPSTVAPQVEEESSDSKVDKQLPEPETVPFVPAAFRQTVAPTPVEPSPAAPAPPKPVEESSPEPVVVKRSKKAKKAAATAAPVDIAGSLAAVTSAIDGSEQESAEPASKKQKKEKKEKTKVEAKDIPTYDYSRAPNLLDNPEAVESVKKTKKPKKVRAKGVEVTGSTFGKATQDKSQPKSGNRSKTFT